jgi:hypothetical protein
MVWRALRRGIAAAALIGAALGVRPAIAQVGGPVANSFTNPATNPYLNPYLNPAMTQTPTNRDTALLYLLSAQRAGGGIGSGAPSGLRTPASGARPAAEMPRSAMVPGAGAARYFQRGLAPAGAGTAAAYYQRRNRYFDHNGR